MPPFPGEETLATVYADIHYYFARPTVRPVIHRFDKASYFYIYHNSTRQSSRIEIANNPDTPDQDAFQGSLKSCRIVNSHNFPTRLTIEVDGVTPAIPSPPSAHSGRDQDEWRLANQDPRDPGKTKYRLHTLDVYFWTPEAAKLVIDTFKDLLQPAQLDVVELQDKPQKLQDNLSSVVQNLENVAISDPAYQNGKTRNSQNQAEHQGIGVRPPPSQTQVPRHASMSVSPVSAMSASDNKTSTQPHEPIANFAPLPYNPAAPPAPEPIAHREDTPPPVDAADGTGLATAALHDQGYSHLGTSQPWTGIPGPPSNPYGHPGSPPAAPPSYGSPPLHQPQHYPPAPGASPPSFAGAPASASVGSDGRHSSVSGQQYMPHQPADPNAHLYGQEPVQTPGSQFYSSVNPGQPHRPLQHVQPQYADYLAAAPPPPGGYSQFQYGSSGQPQPQTAGTNPYDVHSQVYRPTESEVRPHQHSKPSKTDPNSGSGRRPSKFDERADRVEKGVGRLFKKIEKRIG